MQHDNICGMSGKQFLDMFKPPCGLLEYMGARDLTGAPKIDWECSGECNDDRWPFEFRDRSDPIDTLLTRRSMLRAGDVHDR